MNDNTLHLSVGGLRQTEVDRIIAVLPIRHGVAINLTDLAQVEDEADDVTDENRARYDELSIKLDQVRDAAAKATSNAKAAQQVAELAFDEAQGGAIKRARGRVFVQQSEPAPLNFLRDGDIWIRPALLGGVQSVQRREGSAWVMVHPLAAGTITAKSIAESTITAKGIAEGVIGGPAISPDTEAATASDPGPVDYPGGMDARALARLVQALPRGSRVLVIAGTYSRALQGYTSVTEQIQQSVTSRVITANGKQSFGLMNGTKVEPASEAQARGRIADLVIVAVSDDEYTHQLDATVHAVARDRGIAVSINHEGSADA